jgi:hypothetical protein
VPSNWAEVVIDEADVNRAVLLHRRGEGGVSNVSSFAIYHRKAPGLYRFPRVTVLAGSAPGIGQNDVVVDSILSPVLLQELVGNLLYGNPARPSGHMTKDVVVLVMLSPAQSAVLTRVGDTSRECLVDVDVLDAGFVGGVLYVEGESKHGDCTTLEPRHALQAENLIGAVAEGLVLLRMR